ncbi:MAG: glycosyltransferase family 39 protein [Candidatus Omnitrophica bacterium]|nr:glycosyltransferase family 39 protein [Candidatus Omnitrophota bacterium]
MVTNKLLKNERILLCWLFLIALGIRLFIGIILFNPPVRADAHSYEEMALSILSGRGLQIDMHPTSIYMPLYPMFLAAIYFVVGHHYLSIVVSQAILSAFMCIIIYFLAKRLFNKTIALLAGMLLCFDLGFIFIPRHFLSETLYSFLLLISMLFLVRFIQTYKTRDILFAGLFLTLTTLTRSLIFLFPFFISVYLAKVLSRKFGVKLALKKISLFILIFLLPLGIWVIRNYRVHHAFVPLTTLTGESLYACYKPEQGKIFGKFVYDDVCAAGRKIDSEVQRNKYFLDAALQYIRTNYNKIPKLVLLKSMYFFSLFDWEVINYGVYNFSFAFILPFIIAGFFVPLIKKYNHGIAIIYLGLLYNLIILLICYASPRLRLPLEPYLILFAAGGIYFLWQRNKNKFMFISVIFIFLIANYLAYIFSSQAKGLFRTVFQICGLW